MSIRVFEYRIIEQLFNVAAFLPVLMILLSK